MCPLLDLSDNHHVFHSCCQQGTAQGHILTGDNPGQCPARNGRCFGDSGHIKQIVLPSVRSAGPLAAIFTFRCSQSLQPFAGARKEPSIGGLNFNFLILASQFVPSLYIYIHDQVPDGKTTSPGGGPLTRGVPGKAVRQRKLVIKDTVNPIPTLDGFFWY